MIDYKNFEENREYYKKVFTEVIQPHLKYTIKNIRKETVSEYNDEDYSDSIAILGDITVWFNPDDKSYFDRQRIDGTDYFILYSEQQNWLSNNVENLLKASHYELTYSVSTEQKKFIEGLSMIVEDYLYNQFIDEAKQFNGYVS